MRYGMVIDLDRCIGCHACSVACKIENGTSPGVFWNKVSQFEDGIYPKVRRLYIPVFCMHCENPACVTVCPTGATYKDQEGFVRIEQDKCIGCKACMLACPYHVRYLNDGKSYFSKRTPFWGELKENQKEGTVGKCTFCRDRVLRGLEPACVAACPTGARIFGDLSDSNSNLCQLVKSREHFQLDSDFDLRPSVYYLLPKGFILNERAIRNDYSI